MRPKQVICRNGHIKAEVGTDSKGMCIVCQREYYKKKYVEFKNNTGKTQRGNFIYNKCVSNWKNRGVRKDDGSLFTPEDYDRLYQIQQGCCAICKKHVTELKHRLHLDHNHETGAVRGLLCRLCNARVLPTFENKERYETIIKYLGWSK